MRNIGLWYTVKSTIVWYSHWHSKSGFKLASFQSSVQHPDYYSMGKPQYNWVTGSVANKNKTLLKSASEEAW